MAENDTERRVGNLETKVSVIETKVDMFIEEMRRSNDDFKKEMRRQNEMRAKEISDLRQETNQKVDQLSQDIKNVGREVRNLFLTGAIGIGAMFATIVYTIIKGG